jgi:hypothetical protein
VKLSLKDIGPSIAEKHPSLDSETLKDGRPHGSSTAKAYLARDGERTANIQVLVSRAESYLPTIESDLELIRRLVKLNR